MSPLCSNLAYRFPLEYLKLIDKLETNGQESHLIADGHDVATAWRIVESIPSAIHGSVHSLIHNRIVASLVPQPGGRPKALLPPDRRQVAAS